jgi:hypothetical protein
VGSELGGLTLNIVTRGSRKNKNPELADEEDRKCPVGIRGAYDRVNGEVFYVFLKINHPVVRT